MAKKVTSKRVASTASKVLRDKRTGKGSKSAAGSALVQREKMTLRRAFDITVRKYGDALKELEKY